MVASAPSGRASVKRERSEPDALAFDFLSTASSGFSLADEIRRQSSDAEELKQRPAKLAKHAVNSDVTCRHCPEPCAKGQVRCWVHKRAAECIKVNVDKSGTEEEKHDYEDTFGKTKDDEGNIEVANEVLTRFLEQWPDGKSKPGKPRGKDFKVSAITHSRGFRKEEAKQAINPMWDLEFFSMKMKSCRGWDAARSRQEWASLRADASLLQDAGGPKWSKERTEIPSYLVGLDSNVNVTKTFEERRLDTSTKAKAPCQPYITMRTLQLIQPFLF